eukprot:TRINITY_DN59760_c0_g1_i1.p1 TRINITY_DN59760_c0_g1~~TRINITY_DN59760_c0_g1_i1.p1  ORF type:complete len:480 (-),score=172.50 TRINITY_DN59760_c0_g1_i1:153-1547(-)
MDRSGKSQGRRGARNGQNRTNKKFVKKSTGKPFGAGKTNPKFAKKPFNGKKQTGFDGKRRNNQITEEKKEVPQKKRGIKVQMVNQGIKSLNDVEIDPNVTLLNVAKNELTDINLEKLTTLKQLVVLNLSNNQLTSIPTGLTELNNIQALVLNNNNIATIEKTSLPPTLNTVILSHNPIKLLPDDAFSHLDNLTKISMSNAGVSGLPDLSCNADLKELRLSNNKMANVPESVSQLKRLQVYEACHNDIKYFRDLEPLRRCRRLRSLSLRFNPICEHPEFKDIMRAWFPRLQLLNNIKLEKLSDEDRDRLDELLEKELPDPKVTEEVDETSKTEEVVDNDDDSSDDALDLDQIKAMNKTVKLDKKNKDDDLDDWGSDSDSDDALDIEDIQARVLERKKAEPGQKSGVVAVTSKKRRAPKKEENTEEPASKKSKKSKKKSKKDKKKKKKEFSVDALVQNDDALAGWD